MPKLPLEVLAEIISFGSQSEMRGLTTVSRDFYDATRLAGLYIHRTICIDLGKPDIAVELLLEHILCFAEILLHTEEHNCLLSLDLDLSKRTGEDIFAEEVDIPDIFLRAFTLLARMVALSLNWLVKLSIVLPPPLVDPMIECLCRPAPVLKDFTFKCDQGWLRHPSRHALSPQLFAAQASNLRRVSLSSIALCALPVPAFAGVRTACLDFGGSLELDVAANFPRAVDLEFRHEPLGEDAEVARLRFTGLAVQRLVIEDGAEPPLLLPAISRGLRLLSVPEMHLYSNFDTYTTASLCPASPGPVAVRLWPGPPDMGMSIMVSSLEKNWKRLLHYGWWLADEGIPSSMGEFPFHASITYLRLENSYIDGLLHAQLILEALEHVRIDLPSDAWPTPGMLWAPAWKGGVSHADKLPEYWCYEAEYPSYWLMCPRLKTLSLFAIDEPMVVHPHELAYLGCALGQEYVTGYEKTAHLVLVGVSFPEGSSPVLIDVTFSVVKTFEFGAAGLPEDLDSGLWEYQWNPIED